ncbi:DNA-packaging protein [Chryseobacterium indoltheticum]|uniref:DNA-packaging protein n=2 Tax=Chryseobacterium indoltheticum TaxID=254 RepID=A0A3G6N598_9FLAO|nr:DNA-packaging protein [Chryseobacterium indoltheticum]
MNRAKHGRDKLFATPELLWQAACEYFRWIEENPLYETKVFQFQGVVVTKEVPIMRAMTMAGLCFYLNCNETYFRQFKANLPDGEIGFSSVITDIENVVYRQKFEGAAGNLLNANIISRDLGLADKKDISSNGETLSFTNFLIQSSEEDEE